LLSGKNQATDKALPFKGRVRVGMGLLARAARKTHPHPSLPLEGEGENMALPRRNVFT
jgi:hypothetical protein